MIARPVCTLSTSKPSRSVERLAFMRWRTRSVTRFSAFDIFFVIAVRHSSSHTPHDFQPQTRSIVLLFLHTKNSLLRDLRLSTPITLHPAELPPPSATTIL